MSSSVTSTAFKNDGFNKVGKIEGKCCCRTVKCPGADSSPVVTGEKGICGQGDRPDRLPLLMELARILILQT